MELALGTSYAKRAETDHWFLSKKAIENFHFGLQSCIYLQTKTLRTIRRMVPWAFRASTSQFVVSLVANVIVTTICLLLFSFLRPRLKRVYSPRLLLLDMMFPLGKIPNSCFAWVMPAFMANDDDVFYYAGIDALVYLRFMKLCLKISFIILPYGIAVLLPLNFYGGEKLGELEQLSMSNISQGKPQAVGSSAWYLGLHFGHLLFSFGGVEGLWCISTGIPGQGATSTNMLCW